MQRLTRRLSGLNHRSRGEHGAVAVTVALLMIPLLGFAAISIDVAALWAQRQQLQTGADAAALAVAQDCARAGCGHAAATASEFATANVSGGAVAAGVSGTGDHAVTVTTSGVRKQLFAPVLGISATTIVAHATAAWGPPTAGTAVLPVAVSWCDWQSQSGGLRTSTVSRTISLTPDAVPAVPTPSADPSEGTVTVPPVDDAVPASSPPAVPPLVAATAAGPSTGTLPTTTPPSTEAAPPPPPVVPTCAGPRGNPVPLGFGWLPPDGGCRATASIASGADSSAVGQPGAASVPPSCSTADFADLRGKPVLIPIVDQRTGTTASGHYRIYGYAAFVLTGYHFGQSLSAGSPCSGPDSCIAGYFTTSVDLSDEFTYDPDAPDLGAAVVSLTK